MIHVWLCDKSHLHAMGMPRHGVGNPNRTLPGYYWAHHGRGMRGHLHSSEEHRGRKKPKLRTQRKNDPAQPPLRPVPAEPQPVSRSETVILCSWGTPLQFTFWTNSVAGWECGTPWGMHGKSFWGLCYALLPATGVGLQPSGLICLGAATEESGMQGWLLGRLSF